MKRILAIIALAPLGACVVTDADVAGGAVDTLTAAPAADAVNTFTVDVSGSATVRYTSTEPGIVDISVNGANVIEQSLDLSADLSAPIDATVPLDEGPNQIVVTFAYQGESLTQKFVVDAAMDAPAITLPAWSNQYTEHVGMDATGTITVAADAAYDVTAVAVSVDGGPWVPATDDGSGGWDADIVDPDIGDSDVAVRATTMVDGHTSQTTVHGTLTVAPVFDCASANGMLPDTTLIRNNGTEQRVMVGYFGRADAGHDVTFVIDGNAELGHVTVVSATSAYASTEIHANWNLAAMRCDTGGATCNVSYNLAALVDGVQICSQAGYGNVLNMF